MNPSKTPQVQKLTIGELQERLCLYEDASQLGDLSAFAILDQSNQKYLVKIEDQKHSVIYILRLRRIEDGLRLVNLDTAAKNIHDLGFATFTVIMECDTPEP